MKTSHNTVADISESQLYSADAASSHRNAPALLGVAAGDEVIVITRSPHRPSPLGLHRVTVREIAGTRLRIGPIETIDGTPVVDIKVVLGDVRHAVPGHR